MATINKLAIRTIAGRDLVDTWVAWMEVTIKATQIISTRTSHLEAMETQWINLE